MKLFMVAVTALAVPLLSGCSKAQPTRAGGKPVSYWIEALKSPDAKLRKTAAFKLGNVGPTDPAVCPALVEALKDADARVRCEAILALVKFGADANEAIPALNEASHHDSDAKVRSYAAKAVEKLQRAK
jgi:HEAT repeat protein